MADRARQTAEQRVREYIAEEARTQEILSRNPGNPYLLRPKMLLLSDLGLTELPELPERVDILVISNNRLTRLPRLPEGLIDLDCHNNQLTELPELPPTLRSLECQVNPLTTLPLLPPSLERLVCNNTRITSLPELRNLKLVIASNTLISVVPRIPQSLNFLSLDNTPLEEPYATLYRQARQSGDRKGKFIDLNYWRRVQTIKNQGRNLLGLELARPQPDAGLPATTEALGMANVVSGIASFLSGKQGPLKAQQLQLHEQASRHPAAMGFGGVPVRARGVGNRRPGNVERPAGPIPNNNNLPPLVAEGGRRKKTRKSKKTRRTRKGRK